MTSFVSLLLGLRQTTRAALMLQRRFSSTATTTATARQEEFEEPSDTAKDVVHSFRRHGDKVLTADSHRDMVTRVSPRDALFILKSLRAHPGMSGALTFFKWLVSHPDHARVAGLEMECTVLSMLVKARYYRDARDLIKSIILTNRPPPSPRALVKTLIRVTPRADVRPLCLSVVFECYVQINMVDEAFAALDCGKEIGLCFDDKSCNRMLVALRKAGRADEAVGLLKECLDMGARLNVYSFGNVSEIVTLEGIMKEALDYLGDKKDNTFLKELALILHSKDNALQRLQEIKKTTGTTPDIGVYAFLIKGLCGAGRVDEAQEVFGEMRSDGVEPDEVIYSWMVREYAKCGDLKRALTLLTEMTTAGVTPTTYTYHSLMDSLCKLGRMDGARIILNEMRTRGVQPNVVSYNIIINGCCRWKQPFEALRLLQEMDKKQVRADIYTYNNLMFGFCNMKKMGFASALFRRMCAKGVRPNAYGCSILMSGYARKGLVEKAAAIFDWLIKNGERPIDHNYNALIMGYCIKGLIVKGLLLKDEMISRGLRPKPFTYGILIVWSCRRGDVDRAMSLFDEMLADGLTPLPITFVTLIDSLNRNSMEQKASKVYETMKKLGVKSHDTMQETPDGMLCAEVL